MKSYIKTAFKTVSYGWYFIWGHLFAILLYDKKYLKSKFFKGKLWGLAAPGWKWAVKDFWSRRILGVNEGVRFPITFSNTVINPEKFIFHPDDLYITRGRGKFFQCEGGKIIIGKGTWIANNVGLITLNHDTSNPDLHGSGGDIILGEKCWIGINSVVLPGVVLGDHTIVAAGAVVTKSFPEGHCILAGVPAVIKKQNIGE